MSGTFAEFKLVQTNVKEKIREVYGNNTELFLHETNVQQHTFPPIPTPQKNKDK